MSIVGSCQKNIEWKTLKNDDVNVLIQCSNFRLMNGVFTFYLIN